MKEDIQKIELFGKKYWMVKSFCGGFNISPISHFSEDGELLADPFKDLSYAITEGDYILRYHEIIGSVKKDVKFIPI